MKNIKSIHYPNTVSIDNQTIQQVGENVDKIIPIMKSGEMAGIQWFQIIKDGKIIAEIKESVCDIYGEDVVDLESGPF